MKKAATLAALAFMVSAGNAEPLKIRGPDDGYYGHFAILDPDSPGRGHTVHISNTGEPGAPFVYDYHLGGFQCRSATFEFGETTLSCDDGIDRVVIRKSESIVIYAGMKMYRTPH